jgi:hypothetical protein
MTIEYLVNTSVGEVTVVEPRGTWGAITAGTDVRLRFLEAGVYLLPPENA